MKMKTRFWLSPLLIGLFVAILSLGGCSGDDGKDGINGTNGVDGQDGADAIILADYVPLNLELDLSNTIAYNPTSGAVSIHFTLKDADSGNGIDITQNNVDFRILGSELIANNDGTPGQSWLQHLNESFTPSSGSVPGTLTVNSAANGDYTYTPAATLPANSNVNRITVIVRWRDTVQGVSNVTLAYPVNKSYDFYQANPATQVASGADMVTSAACESCHGPRINDFGHGRYTQVKTCNNCHNQTYMTVNRPTDGEGDLAFMIHRIHDAGVFTNLHGGADFSEVTYPTHIFDCNTCHTAAAPNADLHTLIPTRANCSSCHSDVDFATGLNHGGGIQTDDSLCYTSCHKPGSVILGINLDPAWVHSEEKVLAENPQNMSEYAVNISMTPPANGTHYVAGVDLPPLVEVTLVSNDTPPVTVHYEVNAEEGTTDGALASANLYVYGPRSDAVPVLTTNSTTDGGAQQGHSLLLTNGASADPQVMTDPSGYKYQLMDNLADLQAGTYIVRFEGEDYGTPGAPSVPEYRTASSAVLTFQVGTATEEHKLAGDACFNCHGDRIRHIMHLEGQHPHHAPFDTDHCLGCHDKSGNYADYIGNRVHAVHSASITGDLHLVGGIPRDWSEVTFPQEVNNCTICHTDTKGTPVWRHPNEVACGGCHGTVAYPDPLDFPTADQDQLFMEAAAAQHMESNGGNFDVTTLDVPRQCIVCHGEGDVADPYKTHHILKFQEEAVPQP